MSSALKGAFLALCLAAVPPHAGAVSSGLPAFGAIMQFDGDTQSFDFTAMGSQQDNSDGTFDFDGMFTTHPMWDFSWDLTVDPDPFIDGNLTFVNLTANPLSFSTVFNLPVAPFGPPTLMRGDIFSGQLSDSGPGGGDNSATVSSVSGGIFTGLIDGADQLALLGGSVTCSAGSPGCTAAISPLDTGWQIGPGVANDIGIRLQFTLSPGDTFAINTRWEVKPVPLPAAVWLFASALAGAGVLARRRSVVGA